MTQTDSFDWQKLGSEWRTGGAPQIDVAVLRQRLNRQRRWLLTYTGIEIAVLLGVSVWGAWLVTRGTPRMTIAGVMVLALALPNLALIWWARRGSFVADDQSVRGMLDLAIARGRGNVRYVYSVYLIAALAIVAVGIAMTIRALDPTMQPTGFRRLVMAMAGVNCWIVLVVAGTYYYERKIRRRLDGFIRMRETLAATDQTDAIV